MMSFTISLALLLLAVLILGILFACHCLGPRAANWMRMRSSKEEKIGLSNHKQKLFHANGYMASIQSGSEFLLSTSGSFKRFDTIDKEDFHRSQQTAQAQTQTHLLLLNGGVLEATTPMWHLPHTNIRIPPPPNRPAPHPNKTVTFALSQVNEVTVTTTSEMANPVDQERRSCLRLNAATVGAAGGGGVLPQPLEAPPPARLTNAVPVNLSGTAIPRPIAKRQVSLQQGINGGGQPEKTVVTPTPEGERKAPALKRRNSSTNPFLCESTEQMPSNPTTDPLEVTVASLQNATISESPKAAPRAPIDMAPAPTVPAPAEAPSSHHNGNPFVETQSLSSRLLKLHNTTNPFTGLSQRVKGPHLLQKTISEDYLFRKLGVNGPSPMANGNGTGSGSGHVNGNGNGTWSFGRSLLRQDSTLSLGMGLGRRNSSQISLDSGSGSVANSMEGINLERAISCDSVTSDSTFFLEQLDQPYTQITGYLCIGLNYDNICNEGMELTVSVLEAKGLICPFSVESLDTFVRIYLVPDHPGAMQTKVVKDALTPSYNESFNFWLQKRQARHSLWFHLYHNGPAHTLIGEAEMEIGELPRPITTWIPLSDSRKCNARWGELMFSLSYLPTAERLTIVVVKARNLKLDGDQPAPESAETVHSVFVKVYLMDNDRKVLKKRTSLKRKDRSPIFNESMIFSVPPPSLTTAQLRVTVFGVTTSGVTPLGHIVAGSCAVGKGLRHWHQMLSSLRKPVAMWHVLRRAVNQPIFTGGAEAVVAAMQNTLQRSTAKRNSIV
ncbi:uncharacterized protein LOC119557690 isoform X2 [Drosophila subpulchrella]|uniref:uncharacterized protein LOC119557690 isoform X2 n=1 Tax=Drosophila subpulchrella TaxID=1486046 RepID=UPI0018A18D18|nr:uncharacterized protein LOC119557690 isoform X2 [Drosophila subpulchrella]